MTQPAQQSASAPFDQEWSLLLSLCRCGLASKSEAVEHQVQRLAEFYGDTPRGHDLQRLLSAKDGQLTRLVPSDIERRDRNPTMDALLAAINGSDRFSVTKVSENLARATEAAAERHLAALSEETGIDVAMLRTFAAISDERNVHLFTAEAARKAFAGVKLPG